jgi:hypothetical protein
MRTRHNVMLYVYCLSYYCWNTFIDVHFSTTMPCHGHCDILMVTVYIFGTYSQPCNYSSKTVELPLFLGLWLICPSASAVLERGM